jgi:hypothetical protein
MDGKGRTIMPKRKSRYFVLHRSDRDRKENRDKQFEIQLLDSKGRARDVGYVGSSETELIIGNHAVPLAVLEAARRQGPGVGDYVDETGTSMHPVLWIPRSY